MSAETKVSAVEKLHKSQIKIGYPDKWKDYSLVIKSPEEGGTYTQKYGQMAFSRRFADLENQLIKQDGNVSTNRKCVLQPLIYEIVFPAAILQPPFYNQADEAVNYGGIGGYRT
jgi:endothelin-converting enzyme/putative endopeptidase